MQCWSVWYGVRKEVSGLEERYLAWRAIKSDVILWSRGRRTVWCGKVESEEPAGHPASAAGVSGITFVHPSTNDVCFDARIRKGSMASEMRTCHSRENQGRQRMRSLWREKRKLQPTYGEITLIWACLRTVRSRKLFSQLLVRALLSCSWMSYWSLLIGSWYSQDVYISDHQCFSVKSNEVTLAFKWHMDQVLTIQGPLQAILHLYQNLTTMLQELSRRNFQSKL